MQPIKQFVSLACLAGFLSVSPSAWSAETVNIGIVTAPNFVHTFAAQKFKEEVDKALPGKLSLIHI